jgi:hypothetical protein
MLYNMPPFPNIPYYTQQHNLWKNPRKDLDVATLALGSRPRWGGLQGCRPRGTLRSHIMCSRECKVNSQMNSHVGSWSPEWTSKSSKRNYRGQNSLSRKVLYIIGKLLKFRCLVVNLVCPGCPWLVLAPKVLQLCTNHLMLVLCKSMWVREACHFFLIPSQSSSTPLYPSIVLRAKEHAPTPYPSVVFNLGLTFESLKELRVRH